MLAHLEIGPPSVLLLPRKALSLLPESHEAYLEVQGNLGVLLLEGQQQAEAALQVLEAALQRAADTKAPNEVRNPSVLTAPAPAPPGLTAVACMAECCSTDPLPLPLDPWTPGM
jgi:hypothetical protein